MAHRTKTRQSGAGYIEVLVSSLILALCLLAALSLYGFSMNLITKTGDEGVSYNLVRHSLEDARQKGFSSKDSGGNLALPDGTTTLYYDSLGNDEQTAPDTKTIFKLTRVISTDKIDSTGGPAPDATRTVVVTVFYNATGEKVEQSGTLLVRSGV